MADSLFHVQYNGVVRAAKAQKANPIINLLRNRPPLTGVEDKLEEVRSEAEAFSDRHRQLMAVRYYLRYLIRDIDQTWHETVGATNHSTLFDQIRRWRPEDLSTLVVTFNYDRLADWALQDVGELSTTRTPDLAAYIAGPNFRLFKLHGSVDWHRHVDAPELVVDGTYDAFVESVIESAPQAAEGATFHYSGDEGVRSVDGDLVIPAIAVPLRRKQSFQMPAAHEQVLREFLPKVTHVLCIGWRATDEPFMDLLATIERPVYGAAVANTGASATCELLHEVLKAGSELWPSDGGFSTFVTSGALQGFLRQAFRGTPNPKFDRPITIEDPIASPAGPINPGAVGTLVTRHGTTARIQRNVTIRAFRNDADEVRYEAIGEETIGFVPQNVISFAEMPAGTAEPAVSNPSVADVNAVDP
jgi:hypothetical protein